MGVTPLGSAPSRGSATILSLYPENHRDNDKNLSHGAFCVKAGINVTVIGCAEPEAPLSASLVDNEPWQRRAKRAGLSQKGLARLLGVHENTVSLQLRGKWESGTPRYVKTLIRAWEMLPQAQRDALMDGAEEE